MDSDAKQIKVVYIGGSSRSGTGILGRVFSLIGDAAHGGELRRLWSYGLRPGKTCDCGRPHVECPVWSKLLVPGASYIEPSIAERALDQAAARLVARSQASASAYPSVSRLGRSPLHRNVLGSVPGLRSRDGRFGDPR